ncbi:phytoene desaturase family protein [soil metagenome]
MVVVGAGVGGLAAAIRLQVAGHDVAVLERNTEPGGKLGARTIDGFTYETGPSLLTLPSVFEDRFTVAGRSLSDEVDLVRLDPLCRYRFPDDTTLDTRVDPAATEAGIERWSPGSGPAWQAFHDRGARVWGVAQRTFFAGPMDAPRELLGRLRAPRDLRTIDGVRTLHGRATRTFSDPRLVQYVDRYATYSGSSPFAAPATLACIPYLEQAHGVWYTRGGLGALGEALARTATASGVDLRLGAEVTAVETAGDRVTGVHTAHGERLAADIVVANADAHHLYTDLLPDQPARRRADRAPRSSSGFVLLIGVDGRTPRLAHHNVAFPTDYAGEFTDLFERRRPVADPAVYVGCSAVTDPGQAPGGAENWFVLVNAPAGGPTNWEREADHYRDHLLEILVQRGWDLGGRIRHVAVITPADIAERYRSTGGSIYGTSSHGRRAAFLRPGNRGPKRGLYLVGGSSHPGGGLPLVALSGRIVADLVAEDLAVS